jgi:Tannase and feruloyl esterase
MQRRTLLALTGTLMASAALTPVAAGAAPTLPTCSQLATLLASNSFVTQTASDNQGIPSPTATIVPATPTNAAYCNVQFQFSSKSGPAYGYAVGESQTIGIGVGLPLNTTDNGTPSNPKGTTWTAVNGAWNGKIENIGNGGLAGTIGSTTSATNGGFVGSVSDNGHNKAQNGTVGNFGVIQATHQLDIGKFNDFDNESLHQQYVWALYLAQQYYGQAATRNYWNGCSTGGREGLGLAEAFGFDFDGILAGAPATWYEQFWLSNAWPSLVNRDDVVGAGDTALTSAQYNNAVFHAIASCDVQGTDVVADGVVDDPRQCNYTASGDPTIIAAPNGTCTGANCVDPLQAQAIDKIWDGPRNHYGRALWHPWQKVINVGGLLNLGPTVPTGTISAGNAVVWDHVDLTFSPQNLYSTRTLASANPLGQPAPIALEDEFELANAPNGSETVVKADDFSGIIENVYGGPKHGKIIMWQGGADNEIYWEDSVEIYREVATLLGRGNTNFSGMQSWFRYYHAPGVGHCATGPGASPINVTLPDGQTQIFDDLVNWVENGVVPQSAGDSTHMGILATGPGSFGTRPVCPWPTTAIYTGTGSTAVASNYTCGGNLDSNISVLCSGVHTPNDKPTSNQLDYADQGLIPGQCERLDNGNGHNNAQGVD